MLFDCAIIGGGPAGLNAALVLARARRSVVLIDEGKPRNAVTKHSHGFLTRDGVTPAEFREAAHRDIAKYDAVQMMRVRADNIHPEPAGFRVDTASGETIRARKLILATGLKESLPAIAGIRDFYGTSLFSCPYCDGWELRDRPLLVLSETEHAVHLTMMVHNWSKDVVLFTNGASNVTEAQKAKLEQHGLSVVERKVAALEGRDGYLEKVILEDGEQIARCGGFVGTALSQASAFGESLGCAVGPAGGLVTDGFGRTNVAGVFAAGDASVIAPSQLIVAASEGSRAAMGVNLDLTMEIWG